VSKQLRQHRHARGSLAAHFGKRDAKGGREPDPELGEDDVAVDRRNRKTLRVVAICRISRETAVAAAALPLLSHCNCRCYPLLFSLL
jgi:hypothetical protein